MMLGMRVSPNGRDPNESKPRCSPLTKQAKDEYRTIVAAENVNPKIFEEALKRPDRNRYLNILPNKKTQVKIEEDPDFYFNANWILEKRAIACQGPLEKEIDEFWKMVWHADVRTIVMLTNTVEDGKRKCSDYWKIYKDRVKETVFENGEEKIVKRTITITREGETRTVVQYHLQNWPDFNTVAPETLEKLIELVAQEKGIVLGHCSAGVGRTGTFFAAYEAFTKQTDQLQKIAKELRHSETGRVGMIQTVLQYRLALQVAKKFYAAHQRALEKVATLSSENQEAK